MSKNLIIKIALPTPLRHLFDYWVPEDIDPKQLIPGVRVQVPFGKRSLIGILIKVKNESVIAREKLRPITSILDTQPIFSQDVFQLCEFAANYYHHSLGEVLFSAMPTLLRKGHALLQNDDILIATNPVAPTQMLALNATQQEALQTIIAKTNSFQTFLLDGITGSGKTEIYLQAIAHTLKANQQSLVLVPEISLTPQTIARFRARFAEPVVAIHSALTEKERMHAYLAARNNTAKIIIGTRSAIFTPFAKLGLIIVDEEHDASFKQQERFRYHGRDLAIMRASINHIPIVLGSATPSLESLHHGKHSKRYQYLTLPNRAGNASIPNFELIDLRTEKIENGISNKLIETMKLHLEQNNQVLLFLNKRGFAPVLYCVECSYIFKCRYCSVNLVFHKRDARLHCHHCDYKLSLPHTCTECHSHQLQPIGLGTQRLEETLQMHFSDIPIIRVDRDNTRRKGAMQAIFNEIHKQPKAILLGTQMLAKGHHFPNITLVGIIDADSGFFSVDFRATEQLGQLLLQVAGRAGREEKSGTVMIQTRHPQNPALQTLLQQGYGAFAELLLQERAQTNLSPFACLAVVRAQGKSEQLTQQFLCWVKQIADQLNIKQKKVQGEQVDVLGPVAALIAKRKGLYCQHLLIKTARRSVLQQFLKALMMQLNEVPKQWARIQWILDVDPVSVA